MEVTVLFLEDFAMHDLQSALLAAGLTTQKQHDAAKEAQRKHETKQAEKDRHKAVKAVEHQGGNPFNSIRSMMDYIKKELRENPSPGNLGHLIKQFHKVADQLKLKDKRRKRMHAFLAKVGEGLAGRPDHQEKLDFLDEVFLKIDPKLVSE